MAGSYSLESGSQQTASAAIYFTGRRVISRSFRRDTGDMILGLNQKGHTMKCGYSVYQGVFRDGGSYTTYVMCHQFDEEDQPKRSAVILSASYDRDKGYAKVGIHTRAAELLNDPDKLFQDNAFFEIKENRLPGKYIENKTLTQNVDTMLAPMVTTADYEETWEHALNTPQLPPKLKEQILALDAQWDSYVNRPASNSGTAPQGPTLD